MQEGLGAACAAPLMRACMRPVRLVPMVPGTVRRNDVVHLSVWPAVGGSQGADAGNSQQDSGENRSFLQAGTSGLPASQNV